MVTQLARLALVALVVVTNSIFLEGSGAAFILVAVFLLWGWPIALLVAGVMLLLKAAQVEAE